MKAIVHRVGIKAPATDVYQALATVDGLSRWWTRSTSGDANVGGSLAFRFQAPDGTEIGGFDMRVLELQPSRTVRWQVTAGPPDWIGTEIGFALDRQGDYTVVRFDHAGWREPSEFMAHCSTKWATFLLSLRDLAETGAGRPAPDALRIGDWH